MTFMFKSRSLSTVICLVASFVLSCIAAKASLLSDTWINATVLVTNSAGETGMGFLIQRSVSVNESNKFKVFLVTNRYVIGKTDEARLQTERKAPVPLNRMGASIALFKQRYYGT